MYIAMNRFRVTKGSETTFERVWLSRDTYLDQVPGFVEFHLLKGPEAEDHTLYASHTIWENRGAFEAWTRSEAFRAAYHRAGDNKPLYLGHPQFEGFEVCPDRTTQQDQSNVIAKQSCDNEVKYAQLNQATTHHQTLQNP